MKPAARTPRANKNRPTIGLLIGRLGDIGYAANVWPGVADVAAERDANLICFVGGALNALHEFDLQRNVIYDLASPENVDGLVAMSGSIGQFVGPERVLRYYDRFRPLPIVSVAMALEGFPAVLVDNAAGVRQAITHLIEVHGFRRIAFIRGPATNTEAEERFQTYREVLDAHHLPFDGNLVTDGNYLALAGAAAVHRLLDERKAAFDAIASANDEMAIGAMAALRERGMRVPEDMRVTGFDNVEEARYAAPPLTTVRQPLHEQGRKAAEMLLDLLAGKEIPGIVILPTELVIRQSCGCLPRANGFAEVPDEAPASGAHKSTPAARRKKILEQMTAAAGISTPGLEPGWQERLLDSLSKTAGKNNPHGAFLHAWDDTLRRVGARGGDVARWHPVLSVLRRAEPVAATANREDLEPVWRQAESLITDVAQWSQVYRRLQANRRAFDFMTSISEPLMTAFDIAGLADVVADQLPRMGVRACYLSLYEKPEGAAGAAPTAWSRLILAYNESGRVPLPPEGIRFPSRMLVPREILPADKRYARMLEPLHFRDETQLGFLLFEPLQTEVGAHREALSRQISTALKGAILLQERQQAEQSLRASEQAERRFQERLRTLIELGNELSRADSVDAMCRRAVELGRVRLGFDRIGIWFRSPEPGFVVGSWGTDENGQVRDERGIRLPAGTDPSEPLLQKHPTVVRQEDVDLRDSRANPIGRGMHAQAAMWDGEKTIGLVVIDNLLNRRPITDPDCDLLNLYASTLGYLCSRKRAEETLRAGEQKEREFQERLRVLLEISNELSRAESMDALCRQAVELGRSRLGFDRLGIWFYSPDPGSIDGSFGTDAQGNTIDERGIHLSTANLKLEILSQTRPVAMRTDDADLSDGKNHVIGHGSLAQAAMWNGEKVIGYVSMDNLLRHRPITEEDCDLLNLFASSLGYLCSRKRAEENLQAGEQKEREFQERLRVLLELSNELSRAESVDDLCRQAVELGRARLDFDRLAIWFYNPDPGVIKGSFGTSLDGVTTDERAIILKTADLDMEILQQTRPIALVKTDSDLHDMHRTVVGHGSLVHAAMWNGEKVIGLVAMDNLLRHRPVTEQDCELLNLFASSLGYLSSRKRVEETLRESEQKEREFQERLRILLEISNELSRAESVDDLCRRAVELGRERLDFDRIGIWFHRPEAGIIDGSFGTDAEGRIVDERAIHLATSALQLEIVKQTRPIALLWKDAVLRDGNAVEIGRGDQAQAAMWNGEKVIGFVSMDNLLRRRPISEQDCDLLNLFASTLGYLSSRKRAEEELREYSENLEEKVDERTRALRQAQDDLVRQEKLAVLGQLTATVSHELRNPLATIRVSATAVDLKVRDRGLGVERALDRIQRNITRCDTIISELLDYTRMPDLDRKEINFDEWLNRLLDEQSLPEGIALRRDLASGARIRLDAERFQRVVINLLDNARQAIQSRPKEDGGAGELAVESRVEAGRLALSIRDTGGGIPPDILPRIFEPLFSTKGFGVGLGLSIVKGIVEQHGGTIVITSEPGRGTTAVVRLPLAEPPG